MPGRPCMHCGYGLFLSLFRRGIVVYFMSINKFKPNLDLSLVNRTIVTHRQWAKQRLADGVLVQAGKWGDHGGMIIIRSVLPPPP